MVNTNSDIYLINKSMTDTRNVNFNNKNKTQSYIGIRVHKYISDDIKRLSHSYAYEF